MEPMGNVCLILLFLYQLRLIVALQICIMDQVQQAQISNAEFVQLAVQNANFPVI